MPSLVSDSPVYRNSPIGDAIIACLLYYVLRGIVVRPLTGSAPVVLVLDRVRPLWASGEGHFAWLHPGLAHSHAVPLFAAYQRSYEEHSSERSLPEQGRLEGSPDAQSS